LPVDKCPWVRRLEVTVSAAERAVATGSVDVDDFDEPRRGRQPSDLLAELRWHQADAQRLEQNDVVVCHGDACLPNLFVSTDAANCTGMLDLSRLGVADRYLDLALITRSMAAKRLNSQYDAAHADRLLRRYGIRAPDEQRLTFYRLLDEFF
jgi:kanamycin kinase